MFKVGDRVRYHGSATDKHGEYTIIEVKTKDGLTKLYMDFGGFVSWTEGRFCTLVATIEDRIRACLAKRPKIKGFPLIHFAKHTRVRVLTPSNNPDHCLYNWDVGEVGEVVHEYCWEGDRHGTMGCHEDTLFEQVMT